MIDTKATFTSILNDPKLELLIADARAKTAEYSAEDASVTDTVASLNQAVADMQKTAALVTQDLQNEIDEKIALRKEKVAIAIHMLKVATRLCA